jgi:hypothetical protein
MIHHTTFLVNSVALLYGARPYTEENSGRDSGLLAFVTNGEGYHNFHHKFPSDFRNGMRWYQWDPTKWLIGSWRRAMEDSFLPPVRKAEFFDAVWNLWNWDDVTDRFNRGRGKEAEHEALVGRAN